MDGYLMCPHCAYMGDMEEFWDGADSSEVIQDMNKIKLHQLSPEDQKEAKKQLLKLLEGIEND